MLHWRFSRTKCHLETDPYRYRSRNVKLVIAQSIICVTLPSGLSLKISFPAINPSARNVRRLRLSVIAIGTDGRFSPLLPIRGIKTNFTIYDVSTFRYHITSVGDIGRSKFLSLLAFFIGNFTLNCLNLKKIHRHLK